MAIGLTHHQTIINTTDAVFYDSTSFSPPSNSLLVACFSSSLVSNDPTTVTIDAAGDFGLTWTTVDTHFCTTADVANMYRTRMYIFAASTGASPGTDFLRFTHALGSAHVTAGFSIFSLSGTDLAASGGSSTVSQCFVQVVKSTVNPTAATSMSLTLATEGDSDNRPFVFVHHGGNEVTTPRTNWTEIGDHNNFGPNIGFESQWRSDQFETTASATWTTSDMFGAMAFEVKALAGPPTRKLSVNVSPRRW